MHPEDPNVPPFTYTDFTPIPITLTPTPLVTPPHVGPPPSVNPQVVPTLGPAAAILLALGLVAAAVLVIFRKGA